MNKFGEKIYPILKSMNMTFIELSERTDIPTTTLHRYFNGDETKIPNFRIERIAEALNIKPSILVGWEESSRTNIKFEIQKINTIYILMMISYNKSSIDSYLRNIYQKISKRGWNNSDYFIHSEEAYINRFQCFYNKTDLITYEEQNDFNAVVDFDCPDLDDSKPKFKLKDIIAFIENPHLNWLISKTDGSVEIIESCISAYRDLHLYKITEINRSVEISESIIEIKRLMQQRKKAFLTSFEIDLNRFLSIKYISVNSYSFNNDVDKMNDMLAKLDKFFELFSELDRNGIFEDLNKLNPDDRTMVYSLIKRLEEKNEDSNGV